MSPLLAVLATAGASFAAQYAWVDNNAKVKKHHIQASQTVNWVQAGQKVKIIGQWNNWYKLQIPGQDGWVKAGVLDFAPQFPFPGYGYGYGYGNGDNNYYGEEAPARLTHKKTKRGA